MEYFIKFSAILGLFFVFYKLFLEKETFFNMIRGYFLIGIITAIILPFIIIPEYVYIENVFLTKEAEKLAQNYIDERVVGIKHIADAQHIAIASVERVDILVSWNFKHLVKRKTRIGVNLINLKNGYRSIEILAPPEL